MCNEDAQQYLWQVLRLNPNCELSWHYLGHVQMELRSSNDAAMSFKSALDLQPNDKDTLVNLANLYVEMENFEDAVAAYSKAIPGVRHVSPQLGSGAPRDCDAGAAEATEAEAEQSSGTSSGALRAGARLANFARPSSTMPTTPTHTSTWPSVTRTRKLT